MSRGFSEGDPDDVFSRLGTGGAHSWGPVVGFTLDPDGAATASSNLPANESPPFEILTSRDITLDGSAGNKQYVVEIDGEAMLIEQLEDATTIRISQRGIGETQAKTHLVKAETLDYPILTTWQCVFWRSRGATLLVCDVKEDGTLGTPEELLSGIIEQTPQPDGGSAISLKLSPLTVLLKSDVSVTGPESTVVPGLHFHSAPETRNLDIVENLYGLGGGPPFFGQTRDASAAGGGVLDVEEDHVTLWETLYDYALADESGFHPRAGAISVANEILSVTGAQVDGGGGGNDNQFTVETGGAAGPQAAVPAGRNMRPALFRHGVLRTAVFDGWVRWPGDPADDANSFTGIFNDKYAAASPAGAGGAWADLFLNTDSITINRTTNNRTGVDAFVADRGAVRFGELGLVGDLVAPSEAADLAESAGGFPGSNDRMRRLAGVAWSGIIGDPDNFNTLKIRPGQGPRTSPVVIAPTFIQAGETSFYTMDELDLSSGRIAIQTNPGEAEGRRFTTYACEIAQVETVLPAIGDDLDGETVWRVDLINPMDFDIVDWGGAGIAVRVETPKWSSSGEFLSWLLTDDTGFNFPADQVDIQSLLGVGGDPPWAEEWGIPELEPGEELSYSELIEGVLRVTRTSLVMNTRNGLSRITRVRVGAEDAGAVRGEIVENDFTVDEPKWSTDDRLINKIEMSVGYGPVVSDPETGELEWIYEYEDTVDSRTSQRRFSEVATESVDCKAVTLLDGVPLESLENTARGIISQYDAPRRTWEFRLSSAQGAELNVGSTYAVTNQHLRGFVPGGVTGVNGVVVKKKINYGTEGADITMQVYGRNLGGWNAAMLITDIIDVDTVEVETNYYADAVGPDALPHIDMDSFPAGSLVHLRPLYDHDNGADLEVDSVDSVLKQITFTANHGASVGDTLIPQDYPDGAHTEVAPYAWLAGDDETIGAGGDQGVEYG